MRHITLSFIVLILSILTFVRSPAHANASVYQFLPESPVSAFNPSNWTFSVSSTNIPKPADWPGMDESKVFYRLLQHTQPGKDWAIKVGKGGQLYSIYTPQTGELIPMQRQPRGQWVDEVFQHTLPMNVEPIDGDIHQAGYYATSDLERNQQLLSHSIYSPLFNAINLELGQNDKSISFITWPQHAHLPRRLKDNLLFMHENFRDLGDGVIEITVLFTNWGGAKKTLLGVPWATIRSTNGVSTRIVSNPDGTYRSMSQTEPSEAFKLKAQSTNGWMAISQGNQGSDSGIGFVYGNYFPNIESDKSYVNHGHYGAGKTAGTVFTQKRSVDVNPGDSFFYRYYIVLGPLSRIQHYGNLLKDNVQLGKIETPEANARTIAICTSQSTELRRGCSNSQQPLFYTYRDFIRGSLPLFLMKNTDSGAYILSSDPYKIDFPEVPYGKTKYIDFLGWALPQQIASTTSITYQSIKTLISDRSLFPATGSDASLLVRAAAGTASATPTPSQTGNPADLVSTGDSPGNQVNQHDADALKTDFGKTGTAGWIPADINDDGRVDVFDYNVLVGAFGD